MVPKLVLRTRSPTERRPISPIFTAGLAAVKDSVMHRSHTTSRRRFIGGSIATVGASAVPWSAARADDGGPGINGDDTAPAMSDRSVDFIVDPPETVPGAIVRTVAIGEFTAVTTATNPSPSPGAVYSGTGGRVYNGSSGNSWLHVPLEIPVGATLAKVHVIGRIAGGESLTVQTAVFDMFAETQSTETFTQAVDSSFALDVTPSTEFVSAIGRTISLAVLAQTANQAIYGAVYQYLVPEEPAPEPPVVFTAVNPFRAFDSRVGAYAGAGRLAPNASKVVSVKDGHDLLGAVTDADAVPVGATAVTYNLTVAGATGPNFVAITPGDATGFTTSAINTTGTGSIANAGTVAVDGSRSVKLWGGDRTGSVHTIIDITGYYAPQIV